MKFIHSVFKRLLFFSFFLFFFVGTQAQSGGKFSVGVTNIKQDFLPVTGQFYGWNIRLAARLGSRVWFFSPELNYENTNVIPKDTKNPFKNKIQLQTLKMPVGIGWKFTVLPFHKIIVKAGVVGSYILYIEENSVYDFSDLRDLHAGYYGVVGYDLGWFTIDYRYEKSLVDNFSKIKDSKLLSHSIALGFVF